MDFKFNLGQFAQDSVSGYQGTITARAQYLGSSNEYCLIPKMVPGDTKPPEAFWVPEERVVV